MQKYPLRNRRNRSTDDVSIKGGGNSQHSWTVKRDLSHHKMPPRISAPIRQLSTPKPPTVTISKRVLIRELNDLPTWNEVLSAGSKSPASSSPVGSNTCTASASAAAAVMAATTQEPMQQTSAGALEVPGNATAADSQHSTTRNKDDDDNNRRSRQPRITQPGAQPQAMPAASGCASTREFMTLEGLRLRDQINFLPFDPYRTLKFLITELKSRLRTVAPDDITVQRILVDIQQTVKRIRMQNANEPMLPPTSRRGTTKGAGRTAATEFECEAEAESGPITTTVECILPKERRHVIKEEDPLINHARKVNSFCQTMVPHPEWSNVNACQMCEHQVKQGAARGYNQKAINGNSNAEEENVEVKVTGPSQNLGHDGEDRELKKRLSCKSLQDAIENLKIKSNPSPDDTQEIITHLKTELLNSKRELQRTSSSSLAHRWSSTVENLKVQCKRPIDADEENAIQAGETFPPVSIAKPETPPSIEGNKSNSSTQATINKISKESQTNLESPTRVLCHLEKEKLLLLHRFRASEIQNIQGDLNELHTFIRDQLDGIYHSITRENLKMKYHPTSKVPQSSKKSRHNFKRAAGKTSSQGLPPLPCSSSSSVLSSTELPAELRATSPESSVLQGHYKISSSTSNAVDDGNANSTESMMKQMQKQKHNHKPKSSSGSQSTAVQANAEANATHDNNISDVDVATNQALGKKKSKDLHHSHQHCHLAHSCCASIIADTPFCGAKKNHFSAVECENLCCPHSVQRNIMMMAARASAHNEIKSMTKTFPTAMTYHYKHCQQCCQQQPTAAATAKEQTQLISSYPAEAAPAGMPSYSTQHLAADEAAVNLDAVTNAAVKAIIENAYATAATANAGAEPASAATPKHSNGIRTHKHRPSYQAHNSWQCVNLKNATGCQLKKQICGDGYECSCRISSNYDNRSNYPEIHDCQKCRANSINPFARLCSDKMHAVGADNGAAAAASVSASASASDDDNNGGDRDDVCAGGGGDGPRGCRVDAILGISTCQAGQQKQVGKLHHRRRSGQIPFQTDLEEFKEFLDQITSTPRLKKV